MKETNGTPHDEFCVETDVLRECSADGVCAPETAECALDGGAPPGACTGKSCGDECTPTCPPGEPNCVFPQAVHVCQPDGTCGWSAPECNGPKKS